VTEPVSRDQLQALGRRIDHWLDAQVALNPVMRDAERDPDQATRWFVRLIGENKQGFTVVLDLGQRTLGYETYFMALPAENHAQLYGSLLQRNAKMFGLAFVIVGEEHGGDGPAIYLRGRVNNSLLDSDLDGELDQIFGSMYHWVEDSFQSALRIGFASKFAKNP